jgi:hypothetical protein
LLHPTPDSLLSNQRRLSRGMNHGICGEVLQNNRSSGHDAGIQERRETTDSGIRQVREWGIRKEQILASGPGCYQV